MKITKLHGKPISRFVIGFLLSFPLCSAVHSNEEAGGGEEPVAVSVQTVAYQSADRAHEYLGVVKSSNVVELVARVDGVITERLFEEGQVVRKGEPLYTIDPSYYDLSLQQTSYEIKRARSRYEAASKEYTRIQSLVVGDSISPSRIDKIKAEKDLSQASLRLAEVIHERAKLDKHYTSVLSPIEGVVGLVRLDQGSFVNAEEDTLVTIYKVDPVYVEFGVPNTIFMKSALYGDWASRGGDHQAVTQRLNVDVGGYRTLADVVYVSPVVEEKTGSVLIRVAIEGEMGRIRPGMFAEVVLPVAESAEQIVIPESAVHTAHDNAYVYCVGEDNSVEVKHIAVEERRGNQLVVREGLDVGDKLITSPGAGLNSGDVVRIN